MNEMRTSVPGKQIASAQNRIRHVFIRDLTLQAVLGIYEHEKIYPQTIVVNIDLAASEKIEAPINDDHHNVVCYASMVQKVKDIVDRGHVHLVETLAELVASACLEDERVLMARVRIEKPDAIDEALGVGIEIERMR